MIVTPLHHAEWLDIRHILFRVSAIIAVNAIIANLLVSPKRFRKGSAFRAFWRWLLVVNAILAMNWRKCLHSLDGEIPGISDEPKPNRIKRAQDGVSRLV